MECAITSKKPLEKYGINLLINQVPLEFENIATVIDCETDEKDNFVGLALYQGGKNVYYFSGISTVVKAGIESAWLIGHSLKGDAHWLKSWGFNLKPENLIHDTMLQSYVINATKESHSLKDLAKGYFGLEWATYKEMVHPDPEHKRKKVTLDKQDIQKVAEYCASDAVATYKLFELFNKIMTPTQKRIYNAIERPLMQLLYQMEETGVTIDVEHLNWLNSTYIGTIVSLATDLARYTPKGMNINSPKQLKPFIESLIGAKIKNTDKNTLKTLSHPFITSLLDYKRKKKIHSTYIQPYLNLPTLPKIHPDFNQVAKDSKDDLVGISTGRLSCRRPNLQNIPVHGDDGQEIRKLFIPSKGHSLIVADYSQIEYRLLAHFSKEPRLLEAFKNGKDVHTETGLALGVDRSTGKTLNFAAIYGAGAKKIATTAKVTEEKAQEFLDEYWRVLPKVRSWIERVKYQAHLQKGIYTLSRRFIPLVNINSSNMYERWHWERAAVNYQIQGSAAEIIKMAMLKCYEEKCFPILTCHDELIFLVLNEESSVTPMSHHIQNIMENIVKLDVPLEVSLGIGANWSEAKSH